MTFPATDPRMNRGWGSRRTLAEIAARCVCLELSDNLVSVDHHVPEVPMALAKKAAKKPAKKAAPKKPAAKKPAKKAAPKKIVKKPARKAAAKKK